MSVGKKVIISLAVGIALGGIGILITYCISLNSDMGFSDIGFMVGLAVLILGAFAMTKGSPISGMSSASGGANAQSEGNFTANVAMEETKSKRFYEKFREENHVLKVTPTGIALLFGGIIIIAYSVISYYI